MIYRAGEDSAEDSRGVNSAVRCSEIVEEKSEIEEEKDEIPEEKR